MPIRRRRQFQPGTVQGGDVADDGQAQAGAAGVALERRTDPVERCQHALTLGRRDALAAVGHAQFQLFGRALQRHMHLAARMRAEAHAHA